MSDEKRQSDALGSIRLVLRPGSSVVSVSVRRCPVDGQGRSRSRRVLTWGATLRTPGGRLRRAAGRANTLETAEKALRRACWALSGGRGPTPEASGRLLDARATCRRGWPVVVTCAGEAYRLDRATFRAQGAAEAAERLGLERVPGVAPVLLGEGTDRARWVVRLVRSALPRLRELAATPRPPLRSGGPPLPPVATPDRSGWSADELRATASDRPSRRLGPLLPDDDDTSAAGASGASSARPAPSGHDGDDDDAAPWGQ